MCHTGEACALMPQLLVPRCAPVVVRAPYCENRELLALAGLLTFPRPSFTLAGAITAASDRISRAWSRWRFNEQGRFRHRERSITGLQARVILLSTVIVMLQIVIALA